VALFEVGATFRLGVDEEPFVQLRKAGAVLCGPAGTGWAADRRDLDALDAKAILETLLHDLGVSGWSLGDVPQGPFHPGRSAQVLVEDRPVGVMGEIHPRVTQGLDIEGRVAVVVVGLGSLLTASERIVALRDVPRFPRRRDLAFVLPEDTPAGDVQRALEEAGAELLGACELFDVFRGGSLPPGTKSLAFAVDFRAPDRTLTDEEAQIAVDRIVERLASELSATLRAG